MSDSNFDEFLKKIADIFKPWMLVLFIIFSSLGIFSASLYLFTVPSVISGIVFGFVILILFIIPFTIALLYYFKIMRKQKEEEQQVISLYQKQDKNVEIRVEKLD